jgi:mannosyltransferase
MEVTRQGALAPDVASVPERFESQTLSTEAAVDRRLVWLMVVAATVVGAALRLPFVDHQNLWFDEIYTRSIVGEPSLSGVWNHLQATESSPPLYYVLAWLWGGRSAFSMHILSVFTLVAAIPVSYFAFRRMVGELGALATAAIVAVSPVLVWYSLDARAYGLLVLTGLLSVWGFACLLERESPRRYLAWAAASIACVWTHYFGVFLVGAEVVILLAVRPAMRGRTVVWSVVIAVCLTPLVPLASHQQNADGRSAWIGAIPLTKRLEQTVREFAMGQYPPLMWLELAGIAVASAGLAVGVVMAARSGARPRALLAVAALAVAPPLMLALSGIDDRWLYRNLLFLVPLVGALAAPALIRLRGVPLAAYVVLALITSIWINTDWRYERPDWSRAVARIDALDPAAGVIALTQQGASPVLCSNISSTPGFAPSADVCGNEPVAQTYLGRPPVSRTILARRAWVVIEPYVGDHRRSYVPGPFPTAIQNGLRGFTLLRSTSSRGFRLLLFGADRALPIIPAKLPGAAVFAPPP